MEEWNRCTGDTRKKKSEKKLLLRNINATSNTQMRGENGCDTLHPAHSLWELSAVRYEDDCCAYRCQSYQFIREGGVRIPTEDITLPFRREIHTYTYAWRTTRSKRKHTRSCTLHIYRRQMAKLTSMYFIRWEGNACQTQLKVSIHTCFYLRRATINRMFPLSNHHRKPHINKGV
jgi:hypothetical protein